MSAAVRAVDQAPPAEHRVVPQRARRGLAVRALEPRAVDATHGEDLLAAARLHRRRDALGRLLEGARPVLVAELLDVHDLLGGERRVRLRARERPQRCRVIELRVGRDAGRRSLAVGRAHAGVAPVAQIDGLLELLGLIVPLLPQPEHAIDVAIVEEEDRIEGGRVVLAHVGVRAGDLPAVGGLARQVEPADREVDVDVGLLQRHHLRWVPFIGHIWPLTSLTPSRRNRAATPKKGRRKRNYENKRQ